MKQAHTNSGKITFGNILLTILVVGTLVVIGLMGKLYIELTKTPEKTAQMHQEQQNKPQIEVMSPNSKAGDQPVYRDANAKTASQPQTVAQTAASSVAKSTAEPLPQNQENIKEAALLGENTAAKKANTAKKSNKPVVQTTTTEVEPNSIPGERTLKPINNTSAANRGGSSLEQGERPLQPKNQNAQGSKPKKDAIDELF